MPERRMLIQEWRFLDINPMHGFQIEIDTRRKVAYISVDGVTVCRINSWYGDVEYVDSSDIDNIISIESEPKPEDKE
jgi:hypothetical protein